MIKCQKCQHENPDGAKFCNECATKIKLVCPDCGKVNLPGSKICNKCALNLSELASKQLSLEEKLKKIQRYIPEGLTEKILSQRNRIEGEQRHVTIMFCDMKGFTPLAEKLGPEKTFSFIDEVFVIFVQKVHEYGGIVNELRGDGILALFGAPLAVEDAPQRAIRSALDIHREMLRFNEKIKAGKGIPSVLFRIGINTGTVVVGTVGNDLRVQFTVVGDAINMASRMEELAEPGTTYVTESTFKLTEGFFRFEAIGKKRVKGKSEAVSVYRVVAPSNRKTRFDITAERGLTPFVGRKHEIDLMIDAFAKAKTGRGQAISVVSEAGVGKSRLLYEFRNTVSNEDITFLEGKCLTYSKGIAYHPVIDILKSYFNVQEGEKGSAIREKVMVGLKSIDSDAFTTLPCLLELLSVKNSGIDKSIINPEGKKNLIIEALKRIVFKISEIRTLIVAIEDLQWVDRGTEDLLKFLLESVIGGRVFFIFTYRPEFMPIWSSKSCHNQVTLNRVTNQESLTIVHYLLGTKDIDIELQELILDKTEGVPFFIEEFVKSLKELKIIEKNKGRYCFATDFQDVAIPSTIQDIIMARFDLLPEEAKRVLQTGSVIGREFPHDLIKQVLSFSEKELISSLNAIIEAGLAYERAVYEDTAYLFKHALTQQVVYDSILLCNKKDLHGKIAETIMFFYQKNIEDHYEVLAEHFYKNGNYAKSEKFSYLSSEKALKSGSLFEAIIHAKKVVSSIEKQFQTNDQQERLFDARIRLGSILLDLNYHSDAMTAVNPIIDIAPQLKFSKNFSRLYNITGSYYALVDENLSKGIRDFKKSLDISKRNNDLIAFVTAKFWIGTTYSFNCDFENALTNLRRALVISETGNVPYLTAIMRCTISYLYHYFRGEISDAVKTSEKAVRMSEETGSFYPKGMAFTTHGICYYGLGMFDEAIDYLLKGMEQCEKSNHTIWAAAANFYLGEVYFEVGENQISEKYFLRSIKIFEESKLLSSWKYVGMLGSIRARIIRNKKNMNLQSLYKYIQLIKIKVYDGWASKIFGEILLNLEEDLMDEAEVWIKRSVEADRMNGLMFHLGKDYALYAKLFKRKGNQLKAKEHLAMAIKIHKECGAVGWVKKYEEEQSFFS